jgi:hypothetical protein
VAERLRDFIPVVSEVLPQQRSAGKSDEENLVVLLDAAAEAIDRLNCGSHFAIHAAAGVEQNPNADWDILILAEMRNLLRFAVFFQEEIVDFQIRNATAAGIDHSGHNVHEANVHTHLRSSDGCCNRQQQRNGAESLKPALHLNSRAALYYVSAIMDR